MKKIAAMAALVMMVMLGQVAPANAGVAPIEGPNGCGLAIWNIYKPTATSVRATFSHSCTIRPFDMWVYGEIQREGNTARVYRRLQCAAVQACSITLTIPDVNGSQRYRFLIQGDYSGSRAGAVPMAVENRIF